MPDILIVGLALVCAVPLFLAGVCWIAVLGWMKEVEEKVEWREN